jgi:hypothetical protein
MSSFFQWPAKSAFGRVVPKTKIYDHAEAGSRLKDLFVTQVETITWAHKLAPETINLAATEDVPEIQIFEITLRAPELDETILAAMDGSIDFPIVFELVQGERRRMVAAFKRPSDAGGGKWVTSDYMWGPWAKEPVIRASLPVVLDLKGLYAELLRPLMPHNTTVAGQVQEDIRTQVERLEQIRQAEREVAQWQHKLKNEKQYNRKVEINASLRDALARLNELKG